MSAESGTTVGRAILSTLALHGCTHAFCVPGESYLGLLDAFNDRPDVRLVSARHEEGAGLMAEAHAKVTGRPGVVLATRGPGATHLSIALHTAHQDSTPLVAILGQVPRSARGSEAFQEMELADFFRSMSKWTIELQSADAAVAVTRKALAIATNGRPGPVVISVPEDLFSGVTTEPIVGPPTFGLAASGGPALVEAAEALAAASSVAVIVGSEVNRSGPEAGRRLQRLVERLGAVAYTGWRQFDAFPNDHPHYVGTLPYMPQAFYEPLRDADLVLAVGVRLSDKSTLEQQIPRPGQKIVQLTGAVDFVGSNPAPGIAAVGNLEGGLGFLLDALGQANSKPAGRRPADYRARFDRATTPAEGDPDDLDYPSMYGILRRLLPPGTVTTSDAGAFGGWLNRYGRWQEPGTFVAPQAGGMGYGVPAAIGAKLAWPDRPVVAFAGDGGFAMTMSEVQTAVQLGLRKLLFLVFNNQAYGTIMLAQDDAHPGRRVGVQLGDMDFATIATGMGARGARVTTNREFEIAVSAALDDDLPTVVDIRLEGRDIRRSWHDWRP